MTKQDYEALAQLIKANRVPLGGRAQDIEEVGYAMDNLARDMAQYMSRNPHFDEARFLAAAGVA